MADVTQTLVGAGHICGSRQGVGTAITGMTNLLKRCAGRLVHQIWPVTCAARALATDLLKTSVC